MWLCDCRRRTRCEWVWQTRYSHGQARIRKQAWWKRSAMISRVLHHFGILSTALLGKGSESQVYALDPARVLRIVPPGASLAAILARHDFYTQLAARQPPFVIPTVLDQGVVDEHPYTIEQRMHGHDFARILPQLIGRD